MRMLLLMFLFQLTRLFSPPPPALGQEPVFVLIVTIRDASDAPVSGLVVQLRATPTSPVLAQAVTDARGQATFQRLSIERARVVVTGALAGDIKIFQPGQDAQGILVLLSSALAHLDLRVDRRGMVLPDPATMIDLVPDGAVITSPAEQLQPHTAALRTPTVAAKPIDLADDTVRAANNNPMGEARPALVGWRGWLLVALVLAALVAALLRAGRRR